MKASFTTASVGLSPEQLDIWVIALFFFVLLLIAMIGRKYHVQILSERRLKK